MIAFFSLGISLNFCRAPLRVRRELKSKSWRYVMKAVTASVLLAVTVMASPAFARSGSHNAAHRQGNPVYPVYQSNQYLGSDPDPQVRFDLEREAGSRNGGY